jgi:hypothetical protein
VSGDLQEQLYPRNRWFLVDWKSEIDVRHIAERAVAEAQAKPQITEKPKILNCQWGLTPNTTRIGKHRTPQA